MANVITITDFSTFKTLNLNQVQAVILDPHIAVDFYNMLGNNIKTYEEAFGKIQVPQSILKVKADMQDVQQQVKTTERPDYMG